MTTTTSAPVDSFFRATNAHDSAALLATFAQDAVLYNADEGTYRGHQTSRSGTTRNSSERSALSRSRTRSPPERARSSLPVTRGGTFPPGGQIILYFLFTVEDDLITALTIHH